MTDTDTTTKASPADPSLASLIEFDLQQVDNPELSVIEQLEFIPPLVEAMYAHQHLKVGQAMHERYSFTKIGKALSRSRQAISKMYGSGAEKSEEPDSKSGSEPEPADKRIKLRMFGPDGEVLGYAAQMDPEDRLPFEDRAVRVVEPGTTRLEDLFAGASAPDLFCPEMDLRELGGVESVVSTEVAA